MFTKIHFVLPIFSSIALLFNFSFLSSAQTVTNGSITGAPVGNSAIANAAGWTTSSGSPDLCNVGFPNYTAGTDLAPCASPDGDTWLGMASLSYGETAQTTITGLIVGNNYTLSYYGSCFGTGALFNIGPALPTICVGLTCHTISIPKIACTWNTYTLPFTATATTMTLSATNIAPSNDTYANVDGFHFISSLGVEISSFTAELTDENQTKLKWTTNSEINNDYFTIMQSDDAFEWIELQRVSGAGNSSITLNYSAVDPRPFKEITYYKLKQTDFDGKETFSNIQSVQLRSDAFSVAPNPANTFFEVSGNKEELQDLQLFSLIGENVKESIEINYINDSFVRINIEQLKAGVYILKTGSKSLKVNVY